MSNLLLLLLAACFSIVYCQDWKPWENIPSCYPTLPWDHTHWGIHHWPLSNTTNGTHYADVSLASDNCYADNYDFYEGWFGPFDVTESPGWFVCQEIDLDTMVAPLFNYTLCKDIPTWFLYWTGTANVNYTD